MKVTIGKAGLEHSQQAAFPETTLCCRCQGMARIGFVAHENREEILAVREKFAESPEQGIVAVHEIHPNEGKGGRWLHDLCAVAVYFCKDCLETTALYNQG